MSAASFFAAPSYGGDGATRSRPKAVNPQTGEVQSWTSASTFAADLKNPFGLIKSQGRNLVMGLAQRPDLLRMLLAGVPEDGTAKVDEIVDQALGMLAPEAKANEGTAAHAALSHAFQNPGADVVEEFAPLVQAFATKLREYGLKPVATEQKVLNVDYDAIGTFDWLLQESNGAHVTADVKTGDVHRAMLEFSVQMAMYAGARYVVHGDGSVSPMPWVIEQSHGVLIHIDLENNNAVSLYRVDLNIGRFGAGIAEQKRAFSKLKPLSPYVTPVVPAKVSASVPELAQAVQAAGGTVNEVVGAIEVTEPRPASVADVTNLPEHAPAVAPAPEAVHPMDRFDELMTLEKAQLQQVLKHTHGWADLAHNRRWLARAIIAKEQGLDDAAVKKYAAAKDDATPQQAPTPEAAEVPQGPSRETVLQAIAGANNMGALRALQADIVERRGDQAWTDEFATAVELRSHEFAEQQQAEAHASIMSRIKSATSQAELQALWSERTVGGSIDNWTQEMTDAGKARLAEIAAATPPPPANPFG